MNANSPQGLTALIVDDHDAVRRALCDRVHASFGQFQFREAGTVDEIRHTKNEYVRKFITTSGVEAAGADAPSEDPRDARPWSEATK